MARGHIWHRGYAKTVGFSQTDSILAQLAFPQGSTLTRLRYSITFMGHQDVPFDQLPVAQIVYGVTLLEGSPTPAPPDPLANADDDWLWHEGLGARLEQHTVVAGTYASLHAPITDEVRDTKAQRIFFSDNPSLCWIFNQEVHTTFVPLWNMQVTFSALIQGAP